VIAERPITGLQEYQGLALRTAKYSPQFGYLYTILGLTGEAGEVAEKIIDHVFPGGIPQDGALAGAIYGALSDLVSAAKRCEQVKKLIRDCKDDLPEKELYAVAERIAKAGSPNPTVLRGIKLELGDVQWYLSTIANDFGLTLEDVARANIAKLDDRRARSKLHGSGDER
jgi:NTP pyrophosphatase (non-canonical NTP hydrolase)